MTAPDADRHDPNAPPALPAAIVSPPPPPPKRSRWRQAGHLLQRPSIQLLLLTAFAAVLHFSMLWRPGLWIDEAATYERVHLTFRHLLGALRGAGFAPLHYELYWWIDQHFRLSPPVMRFVPALSGTLLVPGVYFLGRQLVAQRTAMLAAAFTACSAWIFAYSRDAKMYADLWLFVALCEACFLWWMRTGRSTAWLAWIASGAAMLGLSPLGAGVLAIQPLQFLTAPGRQARWYRALFFVAGLLILSAGTAAHYMAFNRFATQIDNQGWQASGLGWIDYRGHVVGHPEFSATGPVLITDNATAFLFGWMWLDETGLGITPARMVKAAAFATGAVAIVLAIGLLPWPRWFRGRIEARPQQPWRAGLWLAMGIVLPVYGLYCRSIPEPAGPRQWWGMLNDATHRHAVPWVAGLIVVVIALAAGGDAWRARAARRKSTERPARSDAHGRWHDVIAAGAWMLGIAGVLAALVIVQAIAIKAAADAMKQGQEWHSVYVPRYIGITWPLLAVAVAALLRRLPTRPLRWAAIVAFLGLNLAQGTARALAGTEPPIDRQASDIWCSPPHTIVFLDQPNYGMGPGLSSIYTPVGKYYRDLATGRRGDSRDSVMLSPEDLSPAVRLTSKPSAIQAELQRQPATTHVIVWSHALAGLPPPPDSVGPQLGAAWRRTSEHVYPVRMYWSWRSLYTAVRREYWRTP